MSYRKTTTLTLRVVEEHFADDEPPSLSGIPTYDTDGEDVTHAIRCAGLAKCGPVATERKRVAK